MQRLPPDIGIFSIIPFALLTGRAEAGWTQVRGHLPLRACEEECSEEEGFEVRIEMTSTKQVGQ